MNTHCKLNEQMRSWLQNFNLRLYLNRVNKKGWGVIYAYFRSNGKNYRISTNIKVMEQFWNSCEQRVILNYSKQTKLEYLIHSNADKHLSNILVQIFDKKYYYICNSEITSSIEDVTNSIISTITQYREMSTKIKSEERLILTLQSINERAKTGKSKITYKSFINVFKEFISKESISDSLKSLNDDTMRKYRNWLQINKAAKRGNDCLGAIFTLARDLEKYDGYEFNLHPKRIKKIEDPRTQDERNGNNIALTHEEIDRMLSLELSGQEEIVRDLFIIQCWSGIRYEDLAQILNSSNFRKDGNLITSAFAPNKTKKHNIKVTIPLNNPDLYPRCIDLINKYINTCPYKDNASDLIDYDTIVKTVAQKAGLDRTMIKTEDIAGGKTRSYEISICAEIASHDGRHTFITNCLRYFHLPKLDIIEMSGHKSVEQIETTYDNTTVDDRVRSQNKRLSELRRVSRTSEPTTPPPNPQRSNAYLIDGREEGLSVLYYLGEQIDDKINLSFEEIVSLIEKKQNILRDTFGVDIILLKTLFNMTVPLSKRKLALLSILSVLKG